jgi:hypothetical protein
MKLIDYAKSIRSGGFMEGFMTLIILSHQV